MPTAKLYPLSYAQAQRLGQPVMRAPRYVPARVRPTRQPRSILAGPPAVLRGFGDLGQAGATITLPDGRDHVVRAVNPSGEILTTDGWQSATLPDGTEQWIDTRTGDVLHADGRITRAGGGGLTLPWWFWLAGAGAVLAVGYLAYQGAPRAGRRFKAAGRGAWSAYRTSG